jgi:hypothetical protein
MRLASENPSFVLERLNKHNQQFPEERFLRLTSNLKRIIKSDGNIYLKKQELTNHYVDYDTESDFNGFKLLDIDKISDVIAYFAKYISNLKKVKLMKLLWYTDVSYFIKYGKSMTGLVYLHKPLGALPIGHNEIIRLPSVSVDEQEHENGTAYHILPLPNPVNPIFSLEEQDILSKVATKFRDLHGNEISNYMHNEDAYKSTIEDEVILYSLTNGVKL